MDIREIAQCMITLNLAHSLYPLTPVGLGVESGRNMDVY